MARFDRRELDELLADEAPRWVSLFLPTHRTGREIWGDATRLRNLLSAAEERLRAAGESAADVEALLLPAREMAEEREVWEHSSDGLALYLTPGRMRRYRVPLELEERVVVADRPCVVPLLPLLVDQGRFHVLALSQNHVRLFEGTREGLRELDLDEAPTSLTDAVGVETEPQHLQWHAAGSARWGRPDAVYHGQGGGEDDELVDLEKFVRQVDAGLLEFLRDRETPLVLAAVERLAALYREVTRHPQVLDEGVEGSPDELRPDELHGAAWGLIEPRFRAGLERAAKRYGDLSSTDRVEDEVAPLCLAAHDGRVEELFVERGVRRPGRFVPDERSVTEAEEGGAEDLLDRAAYDTLRLGGKVFAVEREHMPTDGPIAAVLRY